MANNSVDCIVKDALCCGCGICSCICPKQAITVDRNVAGFIIAHNDFNKCVRCGQCLQVCPKEEAYHIRHEGKDVIQPSVELKNINEKVFNGYLCRAADSAILDNGQSGGVVTAVLKYMLEKGLIKEAFINQFDDSLNTNRMVSAMSFSDLMKGAGSYYSQAAADKCVGCMNSAVVVLGCQSAALRRLENFKKETPNYLIGLFCGGNFSGKYYTELEGNHIKSKVTNFRFRNKKYGGWPGNVSFKANGKTIIIDKSIRMKYKETYLCSSCDYCKERVNTSSDFAVGDPWGISCQEMGKGYSVILTYTEKGEDIVSNALGEGYIIGEKIKFNRILEGQGSNYEYYSNYAKRLKNNLGKIERITLSLRRKLFNSNSELSYCINILLFQIYSSSIRWLRRVKGRLRK